ncbi:MAG: hypothetical protein EOP06_01595 [Proteobacteria bacterium]|nr:MAG: hypothetical protein EOP06_01595 [Pseudomonadota bacterium]
MSQSFQSSFETTLKRLCKGFAEKKPSLTVNYHGRQIVRATFGEPPTRQSLRVVGSSIAYDVGRSQVVEAKRLLDVMSSLLDALEGPLNLNEIELATNTCQWLLISSEKKRGISPINEQAAFQNLSNFLDELSSI